MNENDVNYSRMCSEVNSGRGIIDLINSGLTLINNMLFHFLHLNQIQKHCKSKWVTDDAFAHASWRERRDIECCAVKCKTFLFKAFFVYATEVTTKRPDKREERFLEETSQNPIRNSLHIFCSGGRVHIGMKLMTAVSFIGACFIEKHSKRKRKEKKNSNKPLLSAGRNKKCHVCVWVCFTSSAYLLLFFWCVGRNPVLWLSLHLMAHFSSPNDICNPTHTMIGSLSVFG